MNNLFRVPDILPLTDNDFTLDQKEKLNLKAQECCLVLFHENDELSVKLWEIWQRVALQVAGPRFMKCDLISNKGVASAMTNAPRGIVSESWISKVRIPVIFVYRDGKPEGVYNDIVSEQKLIVYASRIACDPLYHECQIVPQSQIDSKYDTSVNNQQPQQPSLIANESEYRG